jgi:type II secretory pathway pseudopilin PulG
VAKPKTKKPSRKFSPFRLAALAVLIAVLALAYNNLNSNAQRQDHDTERKKDLGILQSDAEAYYVKTGKYPTLAQFNDAGFRAANLPNIQLPNLRDPNWSSANPACSVNGQAILQASATQARGCYAYVTQPAGCDNSAAGDCLSYKLSANLESIDTGYTKQSLN